MPRLVEGTDGADEMMLRRLGPYIAGGGRGLMAGAAALLALTALRLSGGPSTVYETLFDFFVSIIPGQVESALIRVLRDAAKLLLLAGSAGLILLAYAALGAAFEALAGRPLLRSRPV